MRALAPVLLAFSVLVGAAWLNARWRNSPIDLSPIVTRGQAGGALTDPSTQVVDIDGVPSIEVVEALRRPLFHADRRPFSPPPVEAVAEPIAEAVAPPPTPLVEPPPAVAAPDLRLVGVSLSGQDRLALLGPVSGSDVRWYAQGQTIDGWTLSGITGDAARFTNNGRSVSFRLYPNDHP